MESGNHMSLSQAISQSLENDVIDSVLNAGHLASFNWRIKTVTIIADRRLCLKTTQSTVGNEDKTRLDANVILM